MHLNPDHHRLHRERWRSDDIKPADVIRLTSLVSDTPVTIPTDNQWGTQLSPFRKVTHGYSKSSVAEQYDYIVLEKAS